MATVTDPDNLKLSANPRGSSPDGNVYIDPTGPTIQLIATDDTGGWVDANSFTKKEGVSLQALYSFLKQQWKDNDVNDFYNYLFPMEAITSEQFEFINDWEPADDASRSYIRTGGWTEKSAAGVEKQSWMGVITLGSIGSTQAPYYAWFDGNGDEGSDFLTAPIPFTFTGVVNEPVKVYGDASNGNVDYRDDQLFLYIRPDTEGTSGNVTGYTFDSSSTAEIGAGAGVTYQVYRFPLTTTNDLNITLTDAEVASLISTKSLEIEFDGTFSSSILPVELSGGPYNFTHIIRSGNGDAANLTPSQVYNFVQYQLRQATDIDAGAGDRTGQLTEELVRFVGSTLETFAINSGTEGVLIDNFNQNEISNLAFRDNANSLKIFPTISAGDISFNNRVSDDPSARFWMFYSTANAGANVYPGSTALIVTDYNGTDISGYIHVKGNTATASETLDGAITGGTSVLTSTAGGLGDLSGQVLRITTGNNIGFYFVESSTATTITIEGTFEETDATDTVTWAVYPKNEDVNGNAIIPYTFDYSDAQGNRGDGLADAPAPITIVTLGLDNAQYVTQTGVIGAGANQNFSVNAALERNYSDPV